MTLAAPANGPLPLLKCLKRLYSSTLEVPFVYVQGPATSGKTTLLREMTEELDKRALFIDALECVNMTVLYERIAARILSEGQRVADRKRPCSAMTELIARLTTVSPSHPPLVIVIDEPERLLSLDATGFATLLRLPEISNGKVCLLLASREPFDSFGAEVTSGLVPYTFSLTAPSRGQSQALILAKVQSELKAAGIADFDVAAAASAIKTIQQVVASTSSDFALHSRLCCSLLAETGGKASSRLVKSIQERLDAAYSLGPITAVALEQLSRTERYLLIAAFIASFQTAKDDCRVFGNTLGKKHRSKAERFASSVEAPSKKPSSEKIPLVLPKLFDQPRLFAVFYFLAEGFAHLPSIPRLQSTVRRLQERGLILASASNALKLDGNRYRVNISHDFAHLIARSVNRELGKLCVNLSRE